MFFRLLLLILQIFFVICVVIFEIGNKKQMFLWLILVCVLPLLGYVIYLLFGNALKFGSSRLIKKHYKTAKYYLKKTDWMERYKKRKFSVRSGGQKMFKYVSNLGFDAWHLSDAKFYLWGEDFVYSLMEDIKNANIFIALEFYIFAEDEVGSRLQKLLIKKLNEGVMVLIVYDAFGSHSTSKKFWEELKNVGASIIPFFPSILKVFQTKINYRNHRKIAIIDGKIAYTGGINIRDDHMGNNPKTSPWRDTQVRLTGGIVYALSDIFLNDYLFAKQTSLKYDEIEQYFPEMEGVGDRIAHVITSGANDKRHYIMDVFLKMIKECKKSLFIATPYFIVDLGIKREILKAKNRGVQVNIIIPAKPDRKLVYAVTLSELRDLFHGGVNIYLFNGFIHSKVVASDNVASVGTCNFDNRSFKLNFEDTIIFYDKSDVDEIKSQYKNDIKMSQKLDERTYKKLTKTYKTLPIVRNILKKLL